MTFSRGHRIALLLFAVALAARVLFIAVHGVTIEPDSVDYRLLARNLAQSGSFSRSEHPPAQPSIQRPPVYPLFLAVVAKGGESATTAAYAQTLLDALVCVMLFFLATRVVRVSFAAAASLLYALHPGAIATSATLLSEVLFTAIFMAAVFLTLFAAERRSTALAAAAGVVFGIATLCRSIGVIYVVALVTLLVLKRVRREALVIALASMAVVAPWVVRNSRVAGRFVSIQAPSILPFYLPTLWWLDQNDEPPIWRYFFANDPYGVRLRDARTPAEVMAAEDVGRHQMMVNLRTNPGAWLKSRVRAFPHLFLNTFDHFTGINRSIGDVTRSREFGLLSIKLGLLFLFTAIPMISACAGLGGSGRTLAGSIAATVWIATLAVHLGMWIDHRYWFPAVPFHFVTAAMGTQYVIDRLRARIGPHSRGYASDRANVV